MTGIANSKLSAMTSVPLDLVFLSFTLKIWAYFVALKMQRVARVMTSMVNSKLNVIILKNVIARSR